LQLDLQMPLFTARNNSGYKYYYAKIKNSAIEYSANIYSPYKLQKYYSVFN